MTPCRDCNQLFEPQFPVQYYCEPCRAQAYRSTEIDASMSNAYARRPYINRNIKLESAIIERFGAVKQAAESADIPAPTLSAWIRNDSQPSRKKRVLRLCQALGVEPEEIFEKEVVRRLRP